MIVVTLNVRVRGGARAEGREEGIIVPGRRGISSLLTELRRIHIYTHLDGRSSIVTYLQGSAVSRCLWFSRQVNM